MSAWATSPNDLLRRRVRELLEDAQAGLSRDAIIGRLAYLLDEHDALADDLSRAEDAERARHDAETDWGPF